MFSSHPIQGYGKLGEAFQLGVCQEPPVRNFSQECLHQASRVFSEVTCYVFYIPVSWNSRPMKQQVNGYVQEPMATPVQQQQTEGEQQQQQDALVQEDHQQTNSTAHVGNSEVQEFSLAIKPKGPPLFKLSALYKSRLKTCIFLHFLLFFVMLAKLSEDILDRMDIFILELEELFIPKPLPFEYLWTASIIFAILGLRALSRNRLSALRNYAAGTFVVGVCPLLCAAVWFYPDVAEYAEKKQEAQVEKWQGIPVGVLWYFFITVAVQVHFYSMFFAFKLIKIWRVKLKRA